MFTVEQASEAIDNWVEELRSPGRKQTIGRLLDTAGAQCCLGVYCDVRHIDRATENGGLPFYRMINDTGWRTNFDKYPPDVIMHDIGLTPKGYPLDGRTWAFPEHLIEKVRRDNFAAYDRPLPSASGIDLAGMNDQARLTFGEIADVIAFNKERLLKWVADHQ